MKNWRQWVAAFGAAAMVAGGPGSATLAVYASEDVTGAIESTETSAALELVGEYATDENLVAEETAAVSTDDEAVIEDDAVTADETGDAESETIPAVTVDATEEAIEADDSADESVTDSTAPAESDEPTAAEAPAASTDIIDPATVEERAEGAELVTETEEEVPAMASDSSSVFLASGDGSAGNPYKISNWSTLQQFAESLEIPDFAYTKNTYVMLTADIDASGHVWEGLDEFNGTFDGNGHTISGLTIQSEDQNVGFVKTISDTATFKDLTMKDITVQYTGSSETHQNQFVGFLVGTAYRVTVSGCSISGTVKGGLDVDYNMAAVGGYIGRVQAFNLRQTVREAKCTIRNSTFNGTVEAGYLTEAGNLLFGYGAGGFVGYVVGAVDMDSCVSRGTIQALGNQGGLIGHIYDHWSNDGSIIQNCRNEATVGFNQYTAGGLVGKIDINDDRPSRDIIRCANTGNIGSITTKYPDSSTFAGSMLHQTTVPHGGLVGSGGAINITESVNEGMITGSYDSVSGIIGAMSTGSAIKDCYNTGTICLNGSKIHAGTIAGTVTGTAELTNCYSNADTSKMPSTYGLIGEVKPASYDTITITNGYSPNGQAYAYWYNTKKGTVETTNVAAVTADEMTDKSAFSGFDFTSVWKMGENGPFLTWENKKQYDGSTFTGWRTVNGKSYWYEKGVKQGTTGRGKEIYDPKSDAWYWLDAVQGGAKAVSKDVYQESNGGKWVRYDANGHMIKGWQTTSAGTYYFDLTTGAMAKGKTTIDGVPCWFDDNTGIGKNLVWEQVNGQDYYWYENGKRQGYDPGDKSYRGKEIYDPAQNAWFWLDNNAQGKKAVSKDVYQPYTYQGKDTIGKWVRYDATGRMIKGWQTTSKGTYYFDPTTGAMTKGNRTIDGRSYYFDEQTGIRR